MNPTTVLATISGRDRPGVTAAFFAALAAHDVEVRDVEQVVIRDRLLLAVLFDLRGDSGALRSSVSQAARALGMESEVTIAEEYPAPRRPERTSRSHVIVIGRPLRPGALSHVAQRIADVGGNIEMVTQLSTEPAASIELVVRAPDPVRLRAALVQAAEDTGVDVAVEPAGLRRRAKRLVVLDVDSTLIRDEAIDVLAERAGVGAEVAAITERAMAGHLDFASSLKARVSLLAGLPLREVEAVRDALRLTPGARTFVRTLRRVGYHVGVVSGGFTFFTDRFVRELELDFAAEYAVPLSQTVAVGDGANDIDMLEAAGLGVAFNAKSALRDAADTAVNLPYLDTVLFVLGISDEDVREAAQPH